MEKKVVLYYMVYMVSYGETANFISFQSYCIQSAFRKPEKHSEYSAAGKLLLWTVCKKDIGTTPHNQALCKHPADSSCTIVLLLRG